MKYRVSTLKMVSLKKELILGMKDRSVTEVITDEKNRIKHSSKNVKKTLDLTGKERELGTAQHRGINRKRN